MFAISALWHQHLNQTEKALATCEDVIQHVLPEVAKTNTNNSNMLGLNYFMLPIIQFLTSQGQNGANRSYDLYNSYVVEPFNSGSKRASVGIMSIRWVLYTFSLEHIFVHNPQPHVYDYFLSTYQANDNFSWCGSPALVILSMFQQKELELMLSGCWMASQKIGMQLKSILQRSLAWASTPFLLKSATILQKDTYEQWSGTCSG